MGQIRILRWLGQGDLLNTIRDPYLKWMIIIPFILALLIRLLLPELTGWASPMVNIVPFYPLVMALIVVFVPLLYGIVIGFLVLDERDEGTLNALKVTPVSMRRYIAYRVSAPMALSFITTLIAYPLAGLISVDWQLLIIVAALASLESPFIALVFACFAENKVQGFAIQKMLGTVLMALLVAFLIDPGWEFIFWALPTYWPVKAFWEGSAGGHGFWLYVAAGIIVHAALISALLWRFNKVVHRL